MEHATEALDENGAFHVKTLFQNMAPSGLGAKDVMLSLLGSFRDNELDRQRREIDSVVLNKWKRWKHDGTLRSEIEPLPSDEDWQVNWSKAAFRLLAIVNRIDLRLNSRIGNAGEGRLVFGITDAVSGEEQLFTVIFEYLQATGGDETKLKEIANAWHAMGESTSFNQDYVDSLKKIVEAFAGRDALPTGVNGSALGQIRTNDIQTSFGSAAGTGWELREWRLSATSGLLDPVAVKETPHNSLDNSATLGFLLSRIGKSLNSELPDALLGMRAITGFSPDFGWQSRGLANSDERLRRFSVHTCNGCHGGDARTADGTPFFQIQPRAEGEEARLSRFLTGVHPDGGSVSAVVIPLTGSTDNPPSTVFSDLLRRKRDFEELLASLPGGIDGPAALFQANRIDFDRVH